MMKDAVEAGCNVNKYVIQALSVSTLFGCNVFILHVSLCIMSAPLTKREKILKERFCLDQAITKCEF